MQNVNLSPDYAGIEVTNAGQIYIDNVRTKFNVKELVSRRIHDHQKNYALGYIRPTLIRAIHFLRVYSDSPMYINTWAYQNAPGNFEHRGFRELESIGAKYSRHKYGMAVDFNITGMSSDEVNDHILAHQADFLSFGFTTIENKAFTTTWTHLDIRYTGLPTTMLVVNP